MLKFSRKITATLFGVPPKRKDHIPLLEGDRSEEGRNRLADWLRRVQELLARPAARRWWRFYKQTIGFALAVTLVAGTGAWLVRNHLVTLKPTCPKPEHVGMLIGSTSGAWWLAACPDVQPGDGIQK